MLQRPAPEVALALASRGHERRANTRFVPTGSISTEGANLVFALYAPTGSIPTVGANLVFAHFAATGSISTVGANLVFAHFAPTDSIPTVGANLVFAHFAATGSIPTAGANLVFAHSAHFRLLFACHPVNIEERGWAPRAHAGHTTALNPHQQKEAQRTQKADNELSALCDFCILLMIPGISSAVTTILPPPASMHPTQQDMPEFLLE